MERHNLLPEQTGIEMQTRKVIWIDQERITVFPMLLENIGIEKIAPHINPEKLLHAMLADSLASERYQL